MQDFFTVLHRTGAVHAAIRTIERPLIFRISRQKLSSQQCFCEGSSTLVAFVVKNGVAVDRHIEAETVHPGIARRARLAELFSDDSTRVIPKRHWRGPEPPYEMPAPRSFLEFVSVDNRYSKRGCVGKFDVTACASGSADANPSCFRC